MLSLSEAPVRKMKEVVDSGKLGKLFFIDSVRINLGLFQHDVNVLWDLAVHDIAILDHVLSQRPVAVSAIAVDPIGNQPASIGYLTLYYDSSAIAHIHASWLAPVKLRQTLIGGDKRMIVYNDNEPLEKIKIYDKRVETPPHYDTFAEFQYSYHYGDMYAPYIKQVEPLKVECQHFLDCIRTGKIPETSGMDGLRVIQILEASSLSLKTGGGRIEIDRNLGTVAAIA